MTSSIKAFISLVITAVVVLSISAVSYAQTVFWQLDVSTPTFTQQTSTFNLDYHVLSTEATDAFTVELKANGTVIETQNVSTSGKYGYNGRFVRSNVPEGTYTYTVKAIRTANPSDTQETSPKTVSVDVPDARIVTASTTSANGNTTTAVAATTNPAASATGAANTNAAITPITETASAKSDTEVKGTSDKTRNFTIAGILILALAGGAVWYGISNYLNKKDA